MPLGLAPAMVSRLAETLVVLARDGIGIVLIQQFTSLALNLAPHAYVLERGRLAYSGSSEGLRRNEHILHSAYLAG